MYEAILGWSDQQAEPVVDNQSIPSHTSIMKVLEKEAWDGGGIVFSHLHCTYKKGNVNKKQS